MASEESTSRSVVLDAVHVEALAQEPSPGEAAIMLEETEQVMRVLTPLQRQILELRLQGHTVEQTVEKAKCAERTVHRALELARKHLLDRLDCD